MTLQLCNYLTKYFPWFLAGFAVFAFYTPTQSAHLAVAVPLYIGIVMLAMGLTMGIDDFKAVLANPKSVGLAVALRYVLMPLVALGVVKTLNLEPVLAAGFILVGCCPSAVASNVMTFLSKGNTALSVTVSTCNTLIAPLATPLLFLLLAGSLIKVNAASMLLDIAKIVFLPVCLGIVIRLTAEARIKPALPYLPAISAVALILIVMSGISVNAGRMASVGLIVFVGVVLHNGFGLALGYLVSRKLFRLDQRDSQAVTFEVGLENTGLAIALVIGHLSPAAALPAAIFGAWHNVSGSALARFWAAQHERRLALDSSLEASPSIAESSSD